MAELMDWKNSAYGQKFIASFSGGIQLQVYM